MYNNSFLSLVRLGIGHRSNSIPSPLDWIKIQALAARQGLSAIILDGLHSVHESGLTVQESMPLDMKLKWIGEVLQIYEQRYEHYKKAIGDLAGFYNAHGFKMMVLKGYACSLDWPIPNHRPCGDIDIWLFGQQKEADAALEKWFKSSKGQEFKIDKSHHHHTVFNWQGFSVENHYDFLNVYHHKSNVELEKILKGLGKDDTHFVELYGEKVYLPSPNLHALFLLRHSMTDFAAFYVTLRQVLDWAFFVEKHTKEVDWDWLISVLKEFHMIEFFNCINAISVDDLGFSAGIFPYVQYNPILKGKVLSDILDPKYSREEPARLIPRLIFKLRRWKGNAWKHKLCYNESMWSAFWSGVWSHLLKPASI